jgi:O-antigen ligase
MKIPLDHPDMRFSRDSCSYPLFALVAVVYVGLVPLLPMVAGKSWYDTARVAQGPLFLIAAVGLAFNQLLGGRSSLRLASPVKVILGVLACLVLASCAHAEVPILAWREIAMLVGIASLVGSIAATTDAHWHRTLVGRGMILAAAAYSACMLVVLGLSMTAGVDLDNARLIFGYDNPRFLNHSQTAMLPLLVGVLAIEGLGKSWRALAWISLACQFTLLALTLGRATTLSLFVSAVLAAMLYGRAGRMFALRLLGGCLSGLMLYWLLFRWLSGAMGISVGDTLNAAAGLESDHSRLYLWRIAVGFIAGSPWLGIGPMHFAHHPNHSGAHPHNIYLQVASEFGLPAALLIFGGLFFLLIRRALSLRPQQSVADADPMSLAALFACVGVAVDAMFSGNLVAPISQVWIALAAGLLYGGNTTAGAKSVATGSASYRFFALVLILGLIASQAWLTLVSFEEWRPQPTLSGSSSDTHVEGAWPQPSGLRRPRFWGTGWF